MFLEENILLVLFYHGNVMVTYPFNENKPVLGATLQNWAWEVARQLVIFLVVF